MKKGRATNPSPLMTILLLFVTLKHAVAPRSYQALSRHAYHTSGDQARLKREERDGGKASREESITNQSRRRSEATEGDRGSAVYGVLGSDW